MPVKNQFVRRSFSSVKSEYWVSLCYYEKNGRVGLFFLDKETKRSLVVTHQFSFFRKVVESALAEAIKEGVVEDAVYFFDLAVENREGETIVLPLSELCLFLDEVDRNTDHSKNFH